MTWRHSKPGRRPTPVVPRNRMLDANTGRAAPMGLLRSAATFVPPAAILYVTHYRLVPLFLARTGQPYLVGYLVGWVPTMALFLIAALVAYRLEGNPVGWRHVSQRYRLRKMDRADWLWAAIVLLVALGLYFGLSFTAVWLARVPLLAPHPSFHPEFGPRPMEAHVPGKLMGMPLRGQWWVAVLFLMGWVLNILGEELWFRGYILPRQELALGNAAWIANGIMFSLNHIWQPWNLLVILPGAMVGAYVVQRRRNTWILILMHAISNASLVILVGLNVVGIRL